MCEGKKSSQIITIRDFSKFDPELAVGKLEGKIDWNHAIQMNDVDDIM